MTAASPVLAAGSRVREALSFLAVGAVSYVVDLGMFNLFRSMGIGPLTSKTLSILLSVVVAYVGNRYIAFARRRGSDVGREIFAFIAANILGALVTLACLGFSHYVLDLTSPVADNISGNVLGVALGTLVRYTAYRFFVFRGARSQELER